MAVPTGAADYWDFVMRFNWNSMQTFKQKGQSRGWEETYHIPTATPLGTTTKVPPLAAARQIQTARAALMAPNVKIVRSTLTLASFFRDRWPIGVVTNYPLTTSSDLEESDNSCNDIEQGILYRFENGTDRFEHIVRGIRDGIVENSKLIVEDSVLSYGPFSAVTGYSGVPFDAGVLPVKMSPQSVSGTNGSITFTVSGGGRLSVPVVATAGAGLQFNGNANATIVVALKGGTRTDPDAFYQPQQMAITLASGAIGSVTLHDISPLNYVYPAGYTYTVFFDGDPLTLQQYLKDTVYIRNFGTTIAQNCSFFSKTQYDVSGLSGVAGVETWPAGSRMSLANTTSPHRIVSNADGNMRFLIPRVSNRQTGRMYKNKRGRRRGTI